MDTATGKNAEPVSLHKYLYANINPVSYTDPSGRVTLIELNTAIGEEARLGALSEGFANVTANRIAGKTVEKLVISELENFTRQYGGTVLKQVYFRGPGGVRFADAVVQLGDRFVAIEVKKGIPLGGQALARLGGQLLTFTQGAAPSLGTASDVILISEESAASAEAAFASIEAKVGTGTLTGVYQGTMELIPILRNALLGL
jgi:hypothetical protein